MGRFYHKKKAYQSAVDRLEKLLQDYPGSSAEKEALYYAGLSHMELGQKKAGPGDPGNAGRKIPVHDRRGQPAAAQARKLMRYYPVFLDLRDRPCVIVGGGRVAERKAISLLEAGADVTVVSPTLTPKLQTLSLSGKITHKTKALRGPRHRRQLSRDRGHRFA